MSTRFENRLLVTSLALAAAGLLTCVALLLDVLMPRGSLMAFLGVLFTAGIAIGAVMASFAWTCDKFDDKRRREYDDDNEPSAVTAARGGRPAVWFDRRSKFDAFFASQWLPNYPGTLRGAISYPSFDKTHTVRGQ